MYSYLLWALMCTCTEAIRTMALLTNYRHHELARLSQGWAAEEWSTLDSCGNSVAHRTLTLNLFLTKALTY